MLRAAKSLFRCKSLQLEQCMNISSTAIRAASATPQPQTSPDILYTGVSIITLESLFFVSLCS